MPRIAYVEQTNMKYATLKVIQQADRIATDYRNRGYNLSLRQLYYQFVSLNLIKNEERSYKRLGNIINNARLMGLIDWNHLEDRGREAHEVDWHGFEPAEQSELIRHAQYGYSLDLWAEQDRRVEVWVEKQALEEVAEKATSGFRTGYFACKGYVSQSEMWAAGRRMQRVIKDGQTPLVLHLGDHDPSGMDMTRDIQERLSMFAEEEIEVRRLALNMDQIDEYNPPPNPAKTTDQRYAKYRDEYGTDSWELDALRPELLVDLVRGEISSVLDYKSFNALISEENTERQKFEVIADRWDEVIEFLAREDD